MKLAAAMCLKATGELGRRITLADETEAAAGRMLRGRQILWMVYDHHKYDEERGSLYDFKDLMSVHFRGDSHLEAFLSNWDSVLAGMKAQPEASLLEVLFYDQLSKSTVLREEIAHYDRARKGSEERTYAFLLEAARRYLERQRLARNRQAVAKGLGGGSSTPATRRGEEEEEERRG